MINNVTIFATSSLVNTPNRNHINLFFYNILHILSIASLAACNPRLTPPASEALPHEADRIQPYPPNPCYWQYKGAPVLLRGGSVEDDLFQIAAIAAHLHLLQAVGGSYFRCTMPSRDRRRVER